MTTNYTTPELITDALATYRVTKLVIEDEILDSPRDKAFDLVEGHPKLTYFLTCPHCVSIWAGLGIAILRHVSPKTAKIVNTMLAASAVTGLIYEKT